MTAAVIPHTYSVVPVASLSPHPDNPNRGDPAGIGQSIEAVGFWGALAVHGPTGHILIGEHRWRAAVETGIEELPALVYDCDADTARAMMIGDNEWSRRARWDLAGLVAVLRELAPTPVMPATGFGEAELAELVARLTPVPPDGFPEFGDDVPTAYQCPSCGYEWSGAAKPKVANPGAVGDARATREHMRRWGDGDEDHAGEA